MTAISLMAECKKALPDAQVFVLIDGRYKRVEKVLLSGVDPVVTGLTSVCLDGVEFVPATDPLLMAAPDLLAACVEFVRKCEDGEAHSVRSYAQMKAAIAKAGR